MVKSTSSIACSEHYHWQHQRYLAYKAAHPDWPHQDRTPCHDCGTPSQGLRCSRCDHLSRIGERAPNWKGGSLTEDGYVIIKVDGRQVRQHRHTWEQAHGPIPAGYVVHHLNGVRHDNRLENLAMMPKGTHDPLSRYSKRRVRKQTYVQLLQARIRELEQQLTSHS